MTFSPRLKVFGIILLIMFNMMGIGPELMREGLREDPLPVVLFFTSFSIVLLTLIEIVVVWFVSYVVGVIRYNDFDKEKWKL